MMTCPYCSEAIQAEAKKCKHCGEWLHIHEAPSQATSTSPEQTSSQQKGSSDILVVPTLNSPSKWKLFLSWALAAYCLVSLGHKQFLNPDVPSVNKLTALGLIAVEVAIAIELVRRFRGLNRDLKDFAEAEKRLSVWGLAWRALVGILAGGVIIFLFEKAFSLDHMLFDFTPSTMLLWEFPRALAITLGTWLLFSRDRLGQLGAIVSLVRGY